MSVPYADLDSMAPAPLQAHFRQCSFASKGLYRLQCMTEATGAFIAPRIVSVSVLIAFVIGLILSLQFGAP